jgi:hypothetical protein
LASKVPAGPAESPNPGVLLIGLRTRNPRRARARAAEITALADLYFFPTVSKHRLTPQQTQNLFCDVFTRHLDAVVTPVSTSARARRCSRTE